MNKAEALLKVIDDTIAYEAAKDNVEVARAALFASILVAREAKATQQEIANCTAVNDGEGLSRQRIAQIIQEAK